MPQINLTEEELRKKKQQEQQKQLPAQKEEEQPWYSGISSFFGKLMDPSGTAKAAEAQESAPLEQRVSDYRSQQPQPAAVPTAPSVRERASPAVEQDRPVSKQEGRTLVQALEEMKRRKEASGDTDKYTANKLDMAVEEARKLYKDQASRNEWFELGQVLAQAIGQYGAAREGLRTGHDMTLRPTRGVDYQARTEKARQEYLDTLRESEGKYQRSEGARKELENLEEDIARAREQERKGKQSEDRDVRQLSEQQRKEELREISVDERDAAKKLEAARTLANSLADENLSPRGQKKLQEKYGSLAAKAGVDIETLQDIDQQAQDEGILGTGFLRGEDKKKKAQLLQEKVVAPISNMLDALAARKRELMGAPPASKPVVQPQQQAGPKPGTVENGYRFRGGNPADKNNWEKVK